MHPIFCFKKTVVVGVVLLCVCCGCGTYAGEHRHGDHTRDGLDVVGLEVKLSEIDVLGIIAASKKFKQIQIIDS